MDENSKPDTWQLEKGERVLPKPLTEERVREIVRDELSRVERCNEEQLKQLTEKAQETVEKLLKEQLERQTARKRRESS
ncbi:hypothetical protein [Oceanimonas smirnovii]|uniref:hypothetical protein n=1 Tax=Oceanimonas smirnovii TaxID=264574 RepID=UPI0003764009|nr:hypothetical protein [Oceanimonas smirnovii]